MAKNVKQLFPVIVLSIITISACQKQENVHLPSTQHIQSSTITMSRTDNKDYKIPQDTAIAWTTRWRILNENEFNNKMPNALIIPIEGLLQLQQEAVNHNTPIAGVKLYLSVNKDNTITAMYVPVDEQKNDILYYENAAANNSTQIYDGTDQCRPCTLSAMTK